MYTKYNNRYYKQAQFFNNDYMLITDSQEIQTIAEYYGKDRRYKRYKAIVDSGSLFVLVGEGDYLEIWGSWHSVAWNNVVYERIV